MRTYQKARFPASDSDFDRKEEPRRERFLRQAAAQLAKIGAGGTVPPALSVPSATTPPGSTDLSQFFKLAGRPGGQAARFATGAGQDGYLSSTDDAAKGFIYFSYPTPISAFDETNNYLGIGTITPGAKFHSNIASSGTTNPGDIGTPIFRGSAAGTTLFDIVPIRFNGGVIDTGIKPNTAAFQVVSTDGVSGMRLVPTGGRAYVQAGYLNSGGSVLAANMTLGGLGATYGTNFAIAFSQMFLDGNTYPKVGIAINPDPAAVSPWNGVVAIKANSTTEPALTLIPNSAATDASPVLEFRKSVSATFGAKYVSMEVDSYDAGRGRLKFFHSDGTTSAGYLSNRNSEFGGSGSKLTIVDRNGNRAQTWDSGAMWNDSKTTTLLDLGASISAFISVILTGDDASTIDRLAISAKRLLLSDQFPGASAVPPTALVQIRNTLDNANVLLGLQRKAGQTGDLTDWWDSDGSTKLAFIDKDGNATFPGVTITTTFNIPDNVFRIIGSGDATKKLAFEVDGITTGTTRTLTVQNASGTLPLLEFANVFTQPQTITISSDSTGLLINTNSAFTEAAFLIHDETASILASVDTSGFLAGSGGFGILNSLSGDFIQVINKSAIGVSRVYKIDNTITTNADFVMTLGTQTISGIKTFSGNNIHSGATTQYQKGLLFTDGTSSFVHFVDQADNTKKLALLLTGITMATTRMWTIGNYSGYPAVPPDEGIATRVLTSNGAGAQPTWQPAGAGSGDQITVNASAVVDADFDDATPAAPAGAVNVKWQKDASSPANISAYVTKTDFRTPSEVTIDFGATPATKKVITTVADTGVSSTSRIVASMAYKAAGSRSLDELEMDQFEVKAGNITAGVSYDLITTCLSGSAAGEYLVNVWRD